MKTIIHVNQHKIRANTKKELRDLEPVLTVKTYKSNDYGYEAIIKDDRRKDTIVHNHRCSAD